jgi:CSLREA domain-containing protein
VKSLPPIPTSDRLRVFFACLTIFNILITPIAAISASSQKSEVRSQKSEAKEPAKSAAEDVFAKPPENLDAPAVPAARAEPAPLPLLPPAGSDIAASLSAALVGTPNNVDGKADPGDTINYTLTLTSSGAGGTGLSLSNPLDSHTTLVPGTLNSTPVAFDQSVSTNEDTALSITIRGQDPDGSNLTFNNISAPAHGSLGSFSAPTCDTAGVCSSTATYTPAANYNGPDSFTFKVNDGTANSNENGTVSITVNSVNDAPTFTVPGNPAAVNEDAGAQSVTSFITGVLPAQSGNTTENGQTVSFVITNNTNASLFSSGPTLTVVGASYPKTATLAYTPATNQNGTATITYHAHDDGGTANGGVDNSADQTFTITVNAVNDPPVVTPPAAFSAQANMKITGLTGLLGNVNDNADNGVNGCVSTTFTVDATSVSGTTAQGGTVSNLNTTNGSFDYDPPAGFTGADTFTYKVKDTGCPAPGVDSSAATVTINVTGPVIWFVDTTLVPAGNGKLATPFNTLAAATAAMGLNAAQRIFVFGGSTTASGTTVTLQGNNTQATQALARGQAQWLIGQGAIGTNFDTFFGISPPSGTIARPSINGTRPTIQGTVTMKENTFVSGLNINTSAGATKGITASSLAAGTSGSLVTVRDVNVTSSTGNAVDFSSAQSFEYTSSSGQTNAITSTTGTALSVVNTTIGANGLTFLSINTNGASNSITLNNTGTSGGLTVTGDGTAARNGTGGTLKGTGTGPTGTGTKTGNDITLTSTAKVSLSRMNIQNAGDDGIKGLSVNGFIVDWCSFSNNGDSNAGNGEGAIVFGDPVNADNGLQGSLPAGANPTRISNSAFSTSAAAHVRMASSGGTLAELDVKKNTFTGLGSNPTAGTGGGGLQIELRGSSTGTLKITGNTFTTNFGAALQGGALGQSNLTFNVLGGTSDGANSFTNNAADALLVSNKNDAQLTTEISSNTFTGNPGNAIFMGNGTPPVSNLSNINGKILNNTITQPGGTPNVSINHVVLVLFSGTAAPSTVQICSNNITNNGQFDGVNVNTPDSGTSPNFKVTVNNNTVNSAASASNAINLNGRQSSTALFKVQSNTTSAPSGIGIQVREVSPATVNLEQGSSSGSASTVLAANNPLAVGSPGFNTFVTGTVGVVANTLPACSAPTTSSIQAQPREYLATNRPSPNADLLYSFLSHDSYVASLFERGIQRAEVGDKRSELGSQRSEPQSGAMFIASAKHHHSELHRSETNVALLQSAPNSPTRSYKHFVPTELKAEGREQKAEGRERNSRVREQNSRVREQNSRVREQNSRVREQNSRVREQNSRVREQNSRVREQNSHVREQNSRVREQNSRVREQNASVTEQNSDVRDQNSGLRLNHARQKTEGGKQKAEGRRFAAVIGSARGVQMEIRGQNSGLRTAKSDVRLNHARNSKLETRNSKLSPGVAAPPTPIGSFPINGTGTGFTLPAGKTTTITFKATLNAPPNLTGVPPATPKISAQGTLSGAFVGNPIVTDDPAVGGTTDPTSTNVDLYDSTASLAASPSNATNTGQAVTFTATIGTSGTPNGSATNRTGTVAFKDNGTTIGGCGSQAVSHVGAVDVATCTTSALATGTHSNITAAYSGDGNFDPSTSAAFTQTVTANGTTTSLVSLTNPSLVTQSVTFTAEVTSTGAVSPPTGTVQFHEGATNFGGPVTLTSGGACPANKGCASVSVSTLTAAGSPHTITADYLAAAGFTNSTGTFSQTVNKSNTSTAIASSANPSNVSQAVTFTATVSSLTAIVPPTGSVHFHEGATDFGTFVLTTGGGCPVNQACATTAAINSLNAGVHTITADYLGDATFNSSTTFLSQQVNQANTTETVLSSLNPSKVSENVTFTGQVVSASVGTVPGPPTGQMKFWDGPAGTGTQIGATKTVASGGTCPANFACAASDPTSALTAGTHTITIEYLGDATFNPNSQTLQQVVNKSDTTTTITANTPNPSNIGQQVDITAHVASSGVTFTNTGTVEFKDGTNTISLCGAQTINGSGDAICSTTALPAGTLSLTAVYSGDATFKTSTSAPVSQQVGPVCPNSVVVTSAADNGAGTLRQAIVDVCDGGTITFDAIQFPAPGPNFINLIDAGGPGIGGELLVNKSVTISGPAASVLTVRRDLAAATNFRVFNITSGKTVTIAGMTIANGKATSAPAFGGGVYNDHGTLTLNACVISSNTADFGGGIYNNGGFSGSASLTVTNTTINGNTANSFGGGIYSDGGGAAATLVIDKSTISANHTNGSGGGLANIGDSTLTVTNSTFSGNTANTSGGGILKDIGVVSLTGVTITGNTADNDNDNSGTGGGLGALTGTVTLQNAIVAGNFNGTGSGAMQQETATVLGSITSGTQQQNTLTVNLSAASSGAGDVSLTLTAAGMNNSPKSLTVTIADETADLVANDIRDKLNADPDVASFFVATSSSNTVILTRKAAAADDTNILLSITGCSCAGVSNSSSSDTTPGVSSGNAKVVVTSTGMAGSPLTISVPVAKPDDQDAVASKLRAALAADATINARFSVSGSANQIILTRLVAVPNDPALNIATDNDTCTGLTPQPTSNDTTGGVAAASPNDIDGGGSVTGTFNLIGDAATAGGLTNGSGNNLVGNAGTGTITTSTVLDTNLADNGGPTRTHKLVDNSPAIDKGNSFTLSTDQRGFQRPVDLPDGTYPNVSDAADIGAYEKQGPTPVPTLTLTSTNTAGTTRDSTPDFSAGNLVVGATVELLRDGNPTSPPTTVTASAATMPLTDNTLVTDGTYSYTVKQQLGSDPPQTSAPVVVTVDTRPSVPDLLTADDTFGPNGTDTDNVTKLTTPRFTGTADFNTNIQLFANGNLVGSGVSDGSGNWTITSSALVDGTYSMTAKEVFGGFTGAASTALSPVVIDTTIADPSVPVLFPGDDSGVPGDNITNKNQPAFTGTAEANSSVQLQANGNLVGTGNADGSGNWSITPSAPLADNTYSIAVLAIDVAGNVSNPVGGLVVTIDTQPPGPPSIPDLIAADDTGALNNDNITSKTTPTFTGSAETNSTVTLYADSGGGPVQVGTGPAGGGTWSIQSSTLTSATYQITAKATDVAGNTSIASTPLSVTIDNQPPNPPSAPDLIAADDTGISSTDNITKKTTPTFSGTADLNSSVQLFKDNGGGPVLAGTGTPDGSGNWSIPSSALTDGTYIMTAVATDTAGNVSPASPSLSVTIDTQPPAPPSTPALNPADDSGTVGDNITNKNTPNFTGTAEANSFVQLFAGVNLVGSGTASGVNWSITSSLLPDNSYSMTATATDLAGNVSSASGALPVVIDTTKPGVSMSSAVGNPTATTPIPVTVTFTEPVIGFIASDIVPGNGTVGNFSGSGAAYSFDLTPTTPGPVSADIGAGVATDLAGNGNTTAVQFNRTFDPSALNVSITAITPNPRHTAVGSIQIVFNKPVTGFDLTDLTLKLNGGANLLTGAQTLTSGDNATWTLGNLAGITGADGTYVLNLTASGSNIQDQTNTPLSSDASASWVMDATPPSVTVNQSGTQTDPVTGPTASTVIHFTAVFTEAVGDFTSGAVSISGTAGATIANITQIAPNDGTTYDVGVQGMTQSGTVIVTIPANGAHDAAGNGNTASTSSDNSVQFNADDFSTFVVNSTADTDDGHCDALGTGTGNQDCTLREAINAANADAGAETITFDGTVFAAPGPYTINLLSVLPDITTDMTINGPGAKVLTVKRNAAPQFRVLFVTNGAFVSITGLTINNGSTSGSGGGIFVTSNSNLAVTRVAVTGNTAGAGGGIYLASGTLNVIESTISSNQSQSDGGGLYSSTGTSTLISNSTFSGNSAAGLGGGIATVGAVTIGNTTVTANSAVGNGGGIEIFPAGSVTIKSTIDGGNTSPQPDIAGVVNSEGYNLIQDTTGATINETLNPGTNITGQNPRLNPLADNGGPTQTHSLLCTSPAIDKGSAFGLTNDQRGSTRPFDFADTVYPNAAGGDGSDIGAFETQSASGCVPVATPVSASTNEDNPVAITLTGTFAQNAALTFTITEQPANAPALTPSAPVCSGSGPVTCQATVNYSPNPDFNGPDLFKYQVSAGAGLESNEADVNVTVNPVNDVPSFLVTATATVPEDAGPQTIPGFANNLSRGPADESGQALQFIVTNNTNPGLFSGAPAIDSTGMLSFTSAPNAFGSAQITVVLKDSGGTANGGIDTSPPQSFTINVTAVPDTPSVTNATTTVNTQSTSGLVISRNPADGNEVSNFQISNIQNGTLFRPDGVGTVVDGEFITVGEGLAGLKFTPAHNSTANGSFDVQASLDNTVNGLGGGLTTATITVSCGPTVVTNSNDSGAGSLRDVIQHACPGATITFNMTPGNVTSPITLTTAHLFIDKNLTIQGPGANLLTVQRSNAGATPQFSIFYVVGGNNVNISGLTLTNGDSPDDGGAINNFGTLVVDGLALSGNHATLSGGAIYNSSTGLLTISNTTISGNQADVGALVNAGANATITNTTFTGNTNQTSAPGQAIFGFTDSVTTVTNCTVSLNTGDAALFQNPSGVGRMDVKNTIASGNPGFDVANINDLGHNLIGGNALLAPLGNYGGPTQTMALLPGSPAINAGDNAAISNPPFAGPPFTDQRGTGFNRIVGSSVDIGAFESRGFTITATSGTPQSTAITTAFASPLVATVSSASGEPVAGGVITFTAPGTGASATLTGGATTANATINGGGQANSSATANGIVGGPYNVAAKAIGIASPASFSLTNTKGVTATAVASSANPSDFGQTVTFTATITSAIGTPTGAVQFKDGGANLGAAAALNASGVASLNTSALAVGSHTITADYSGDGNSLASSGTLAGGQVVKAQPSLSINDVSTTEGDSGTKVLNFTVTLSAASSLPVTVGYATANGTATAPSDYVAIPLTSLTFDPGVTTQMISVLINGDVNFEPDETFTVNLSGPTNATVSKATGTGTILNDDAQGGFFSFGPSTYAVNESAGLVTVTVTRTNDVSRAATVDYATDDTGASTDCSAVNTGLASQRCDYTSMFGTLAFAANETQKTIDIPVNQDAYTEGPETFTLKLANPTGGAVLISPSTATVTINDSPSPAPNAIDDTTTFVRQQYHDFLNRDADASGLAFWKNNIDKCNDPAQRPPGQTSAQCIELNRIITSAAFFLSIEFRQTGGLVRDFYVASLNRPLTNNMPNFVEFMRDTQAIQKGVVVGQGNWQQILAANQTAFMNDFVMRPEFVGLYPTTDTPTTYVNKLYNHAGVPPSDPGEKAAAIAEFGAAATAADPGARGRALLRITQNSIFQARELPRGFVQMQYFGYLRRNPNDQPDNNFNGFDFWLSKLIQFNGDYLQAEMVKAFITSLEYRKRFGP